MFASFAHELFWRSLHLQTNFVEPSVAFVACNPPNSSFALNRLLQVANLAEPLSRVSGLLTCLETVVDDFEFLAQYFDGCEQLFCVEQPVQ